MAAELVKTVQTKYTLNQLIGGLVNGWYKKFGVIPKKESIGVLYAQNALETGGTVSMWNNNIGNVKFVPSSNPDLDTGKQYMMLANTWEMINGKRVVFQPPHQATWFRAFPTLGDGIAQHLDFLKNTRYRTAFTAVEAGDPANFAHLLKVAGYYTAAEADYVKLMNFYFNKFMKDMTFEKEVEALQASIAPEPTPEPEPVVLPEPQPAPPPLQTVPQPTPSKPNVFETIFSALSGFFKKK